MHVTMFVPNKYRFSGQKSASTDLIRFLLTRVRCPLRLHFLCFLSSSLLSYLNTKMVRFIFDAPLGASEEGRLMTC